VVALRRRGEAIAQQETERTLRRLLHKHPDDERIRQEVKRLAARIVAKLLHEPTVRLKARAANGDGASFAQALAELFELEIPAPSSALSVTTAGAREYRESGANHHSPLLSASNDAAFFYPEHCNGVYAHE
jgi:glutamyl-tRNA reductase